MHKMFFQISDNEFINLMSIADASITKDGCNWEVSLRNFQNKLTKLTGDRAAKFVEEHTNMDTGKRYL